MLFSRLIHSIGTLSAMESQISLLRYIYILYLLLFCQELRCEEIRHDHCSHLKVCNCTHLSGTGLRVSCFSEDFPKNIPSNTVELELAGLNINDLPHAFPNLSQLRALKIHDGRVNNLMNSSFDGLTKLQNLTINNVNLAKISAAAFMPLKMIQMIDLSKNPNLGVKQMEYIYYGLSNSSLEIYIGDGINTVRGLVIDTIYKYLHFKN